jgi:hypothetical protein
MVGHRPDDDIHGRAPGTALRRSSFIGWNQFSVIFIGLLRRIGISLYRGR